CAGVAAGAWARPAMVAWTPPTIARVTAKVAAVAVSARSRVCMSAIVYRPSALLRPAAAAPEIRLQQVCQRVHGAQFAVLDAEEMRIGRAAAADSVSGAEGAEHHDRSDRRIHDETAVGDVDAARDADVAAVGRRSVAGVRAAFRAIARVAPRHEILFAF